jgi:NAD(P)-dependent dehydrogenase (short-subunit alcohol dehydrogenase family)
MVSDGQAILISGASTGIGHCCAVRLADAGYRVFAGVRSERAAEELAAGASDRLIPVILDITDSQNIRQVAERLQSENLYGVVNNAGTALLGPLELLPVQKIREQFEVNVLGHIAVTQALLPLLRKSCGRIVNISSLSGIVAFPFAGAYAGSKFALEAFSDALRRELWPSNIRVCVVEPGNIRTPIWEKSSHQAMSIAARFSPDAEEVYGQSLATRARNLDKMRDPSEVAAVVLKALQSKRPKVRYVVGRDARFYSLLSRLLPDAALDRWIRSRT